MNFKFKRIITTGTFIPEIDGLRFLAITSVVLLHLSGFLLVKDMNDYTTTYNFGIYDRFLSHGHIGVPLFFVISGFILGKPFANSYINHQPLISIKSFFLRRLTRLEPPYLLVMTIFFFASVYLVKTISLEEGLPSYLASITYTHNFFYGKPIQPLLNVVAWSLEIEVQFYIITPLLALLFTIRNNSLRRSILVGAALFFLIVDFYESLSFISIINYFEFFLIGFLLADLFVSKATLFRKSKVDYLLCLLFAINIWGFTINDFNSIYSKIGWECVQLTSMFFLYYLVLFHKAIPLLSNTIVTNIGGMCYTIYLLHFPIIGLFGNPLVKINFSNNSLLSTSIYSTVLLAIILIISSLFFLLIERPCMDKNWYKRDRNLVD